MEQHKDPQMKAASTDTEGSDPQEIGAAYVHGSLPECLGQIFNQIFRQGWRLITEQAQGEKPAGDFTLYVDLDAEGGSRFRTSMQVQAIRSCWHLPAAKGCDDCRPAFDHADLPSAFWDDFPELSAAAAAVVLRRCMAELKRQKADLDFRRFEVFDECLLEQSRLCRWKIEALPGRPFQGYCRNDERTS